MPRRKSRSKTTPAEEPVEAEATPCEQTSDCSDQSSTKRTSRQNVETSSTGSGSSAPSDRSRRSTTVAQTAASQAGARVTRSLTRGPASVSPPPPRRSRGAGSTESPALRVKSSPRVGSKVSYQEDSEGEDESAAHHDIKPEEEDEFQVEEDEMESDSEESRDTGKRKAIRSRQVSTPRSRRRTASGKKGGRAKAATPKAKKAPKIQKENEDAVVDDSDLKAEEENEAEAKAEIVSEAKEDSTVEEIEPKGRRRRSGRQTPAAADPAQATSGRTKRSRTKVSQPPVEAPAPSRRSSRARKTLMEDVKDAELDEDDEEEEEEDFNDEEEKIEVKPRASRKRKAEDDLTNKKKKSKAVETTEDSESKMEVEKMEEVSDENKPMASDEADKDKEVESKVEHTSDESIKCEDKEQPMDVDETTPVSEPEKIEVKGKEKDEKPQVQKEENIPVKVEKTVAPPEEKVEKKEPASTPVVEGQEQKARASAKLETPSVTSPVNKSLIAPKPIVDTPSSNVAKQPSPAASPEKKLPVASPAKVVQSTAPTPANVQSNVSPAKIVQPQTSPAKSMQFSDSPPKSVQPPETPKIVQTPASPVKNVQFQPSPTKAAPTKNVQPLPVSPAKAVQPPLISPKVAQPVEPSPKTVPSPAIPVKNAPPLLASPTKSAPPTVSPAKIIQNVSLSPAKNVPTGSPDKIVQPAPSLSKNLPPVPSPKSALSPEKIMKVAEKSPSSTDGIAKKSQPITDIGTPKPVEKITSSPSNIQLSTPVDSKSPTENQNLSSTTALAGSPQKSHISPLQQLASSNSSQRSPIMHSTPPAVQPLSATPGAINTMRSNPSGPTNTISSPAVQEIDQNKGSQQSSISDVQLKPNDQAVNGNKDKSSQSIVKVPLTHNGPPTSNKPPATEICLPGRKNVINSSCPITGPRFAAVSLNLGGISATNRHEKVLMEIKSLNADILCFQEVGSEYFKDKLENSLDVLGYKGQRSLNGLATFLRTSALTCYSQKVLSILDIVNKDLQVSGLDSEAQNAVKTYLQKEVVGEVMYTQAKVGDKTLNVANIHIKKCDISTHALQVSCVVRELLRQSDAEGCHSQLLCGTFNMDETYPGYQLIRDGYLSNDMIETLQKQTHIQIPNKENSALVNLLWKSFQHSSSQLKSSYATVIGHELKKQSSSENCKLPLDSLWFSSDSLNTRSVLDVELSSFETIDKLSLRAELCFIN